jgi:hypothetical protein
MGHCGKFFYALWATTVNDSPTEPRTTEPRKTEPRKTQPQSVNPVNLVVCYGPLRWIYLCAMGHCGGFGYGLWATARNKAVQYKSVVISAL